MNYWETQYLDNAVELENQFARHTVTGLMLPTGSSGSPISSGDNYEYYLVEKKGGLKLHDHLPQILHLFSWTNRLPELTPWRSTILKI